MVVLHLTKEAHASVSARKVIQDHVANLEIHAYQIHA